MSFTDKKFHILSVDDTEINRLVIEKMLTGSGYMVTSAVSGVEAIALLNGNCKPDLILLDIMMPEVNGFETCQLIKNSNRSMSKIPVIFLSAMSDLKGITDGFNAGGVDYITKPFQKVELLARINTHLKLKHYQDQEIEQTQRELIYTIARITDAHSAEAGNHIKRVSEYAKLLALLVGYDKEKAEIFKLAAAMHDVGKIGIPHSILNKPGQLSPDELIVMRKHPNIGHNILSQSSGSLLRAAAIVAHQHHERYDGSGYPRGLKGKEIHILGRIAALADVFDALDTKRPYKQRWTLHETIVFIQNESGKHFDPHLVNLLIQNFGYFRKIRDKFPD
ncbi:MAG: response regulator [Helicobacteraceae bacterium]|jgi:putative two-component system response regulator|nr:response regulator [Helicobacteraceae bacterium]